MAFPGTPTTRQGYVSSTTNATSWAAFSGVSVPAGSLALFIVAADGAPTLSVGGSDTDWLVVRQDQVSTTARGALFTYFNNTGSAVNKAFTLASTTSEQYSGILYIIPRATAGYELVLNSTAVGATAASPNPPSHDAGASRDHLWIAAVCSDNTNVASAAPTNYTNLTTRAAGGTAGASTYAAERTLTAQTEDPDAFTQGTSRAHVRYTIAIWEQAVPSVAGAECSHAHSADAPTVTFSAGSTAITPAEAAHGHAAEASSVTFTPGAVSIVPADAAHAHAADSAGVAPRYVFAPAEALHGHAADAAGITPRYVFAPADAAHGHSADSVTVSFTGAGVVSIAPADATHGHTADAVTVSAANAERRILRSRRWRPLPEWIEELPEPVKAELPKADVAALASAVVAEMRARAEAATAAHVETVARAGNLAAERRKLREARATLYRAELALREAEEAAERHMARLREDDEFLLLA